VCCCCCLSVCLPVCAGLMCCPEGVTEQWYEDHPEDYKRHPAMFLGQVSTDDVQADGCAAKLYHEAMVAHNATSELHLIPLDRQRCFAIGQHQDPTVGSASDGKDTYTRYCDSGGGPASVFRSMNHTTGMAEAVEPLVRFLLKAL
jgi:hypothetical protein